MKQNFTSDEMQPLVEQLQTVFDTVVLLPAQENDELTPEKDCLMLHCAREESPACCVVSRAIEIDGKPYLLRMGGVLSGRAQAENNMTERELQIYQDDLVRDFLSGTRNARYWKTIFGKELPAHVSAGKSVAVALVSIDAFDTIETEHGALNADQLICYVANQWKKFYDEGSEKVVCRLAKSQFAIGCVGATENDLEEQMRFLYEKMNLVCTSTCGMLCRIPFTLSIACAATNEIESVNLNDLMTLCESRLRSTVLQGGNTVARAELR